MANSSDKIMRTQWIIDQIECDWVTLSPHPNSQDKDGQTDPFEVPLALIGSTAQEGQVVTFCCEIDREETRRIHSELQAKLDALTTDDDGEDFSL